MGIFGTTRYDETVDRLRSTAGDEAARLKHQMGERAAAARKQGSALAQTVGREIVEAERRAVEAARARPLQTLGIVLIGVGLVLLSSRR